MNDGKSVSTGSLDKEQQFSDSTAQESDMDALMDLSGLPTALIVTNIPSVLFTDDGCKEHFQELFYLYDPHVRFEYFKSFKRCRVYFSSVKAATLARISCHQLDFMGNPLRCFFAQIIDTNDAAPTKVNLEPPELEKQWLISPPASPPVGWEQHREEAPIINFDLVSRLAAIAEPVQLSKQRVKTYLDEPHEIHACSHIAPAIVVHTCADDPEAPVVKPKIKQTSRPDAQHDEH